MTENLGEVDNGRRVWLPLVGWLMMLSLTAWSAWDLISRASTVVPTDHGTEFIDIGYSDLWYSSLIIFSTGIIAALSPGKRLISWLLALTLAIVAINMIGQRVDEIEFVRTPPCWGRHSVDPGSGESCPEGMRDDFTVDELRAFYRRER